MVGALPIPRLWNRRIDRDWPGNSDDSRFESFQASADSPSGRGLWAVFSLRDLFGFGVPRLDCSVTGLRESIAAVQERYKFPGFLGVPIASLQGIAVRPLPCNYNVFGAGLRPFTAATRAQIPSGTPDETIRPSSSITFCGSKRSRLIRLAWFCAL
jgi:hypothetical protein